MRLRNFQYLHFTVLILLQVSSVIDSLKLFPSECRQRGLTYRGPLKVGVEIRLNGVKTDFCEVVVGEVCLLSFFKYIIHFFYFNVIFEFFNSLSLDQEALQLP